MKLLKCDKQSSDIMPFPNLGNMLALRKASPDGGGFTHDKPGRGYDEMHIMHYDSGRAESTQIEDIQDFWKREYDFVIMDLPAVLDDPSVTTIGRLADEVIVVVESERERAEVITTAMESMSSAHVTIKGVILNKRRYYIPEWLYKTL
jgi:cellulose biosynthesis protein BcsQ